MTNWTAGMKITAARLNDDTPTKTSTGLVAAPGFSAVSFAGYRAGNVVSLDIYLGVTTTVTPNTSGNITPDVLACTVPAGWRPTDQATNGIHDNGSASGGFVLDLDGTCTLRTANQSISSGTNMRLHAAFIID